MKKTRPLRHPVYGVSLAAIVLVNTTGCRRHVPLLDGPPHHTLGFHRSCKIFTGVYVMQNTVVVGEGDKLKMHLLGKNLIRGKREEKIDHKGV